MRPRCNGSGRGRAQRRASHLRACYQWSLDITRQWHAGGDHFQLAAHRPLTSLERLAPRPRPHNDRLLRWRLRNGRAGAKFRCATISAYLFDEPATYTKGTAITINTPTSGGGPVASYSISPALPAGLSFDASTGIISGTPTVVSAATNYTVTATNTGGSTPRYR